MDEGTQGGVVGAASADETGAVLWNLTEAELESLRDEVVDLLSRLLQADTSNPPGDVRPAAEVMRRYFAAHGIEAVFVGETPELVNCVARLPGSDGHPTLAMLSHLDVVPVPDAAAWTEPPFSGSVKNGFVWGRGALDMKNQAAAQAVAFTRLARRATAGDRLRGDLLFVAVADEETGDRSGARWLVGHEPDLVRCDYVINEGGSEMTRLGDRRLYRIEVGEKGYAGCRITVSGHGGHGSMPQHTASVAYAVAQIVSAVETHEPAVSASHIPVAYIDAVVADRGLRARLKDPVSARAALPDLAAVDPDAARIIESHLGLTFATTNVRVGDGAVNVIPPHAEIIVDCRLLPGQSEDEVRGELARALRRVDAQWELDFLNFVQSNESPADSPFAAAVREVMTGLVPGAEVICSHSSGFTDSAYFRSASPGAVAYGFQPFVEEDGAAIAPRFHGLDERVAVADLVLQAVFSERLAVRLLA